MSESTANHLKYIRAFAAFTALFAASESLSAVEAHRWPAALFGLGTALMMAALTMRPSVMLGRVTASGATLLTLPANEPLAKPALVSAVTGAACALVAAVLWLVSRVPSN